MAAVVLLWVASWPPPPLRSALPVDSQVQQRTVAGAIHVHSTVSDGSGTRAEIAAAAARAGLRFVVFTDHGDGTRQPEPPTYLSGVLCLDGVEISTNGGHYVALGLDAAPFRLGGEASAVVEDVRRLGGLGIVAHPDSPKATLAWRDWSVAADGIEWLSADSGWRNESWGSLGRTLLGYLARPAPALASMLDREAVTIDRWDAATAGRRMPAFGAHDAHGGPGRSQEEAGRFGFPRIPSYEAAFRSFSQRVVLRTPLTGSPTVDAAALLEALRGGRSYTTLDAAAAPAWLEFSGQRGGQVAQMGERLAGEGQGTLVVRAPAIEGSTVVLLRNGAAVAESRSGELSTTTSGPGAYRVEVRLPDRATRAPWIFSNPIYLDLPSPPAPQPEPDVDEGVAFEHADWHTEHDPSTTATLMADGDLRGMAFQLGENTRSPFAALVVSLPRPQPVFDGIVLDIASDVPARLSVQFRSGDGSARWKRSAFVGPGAGRTILRSSEFAPAEKGGANFEPAVAASILLVVDLVNSRPGTSGRFFVRHLALASVR